MYRSLLLTFAALLCNSHAVEHRSHTDVLQAPDGSPIVVARGAISSELPTGAVELLYPFQDFSQWKYTCNGVAFNYTAPQPGTGTIVRAVTNEKPAQSYDCQIRSLIHLPSTGDRVIPSNTTMLFRVSARSTRTHVARALLGFQAFGGRIPKALEESVTLYSDQWQAFSIPFKSTFECNQTSACEVVLFFGYFPQALDLANASLLAYYPSKLQPASGDVQPSDLPTCCATYPGRPGESRWRVQAGARIPGVRTALLNVSVSQASATAGPGQGRAVVGAKVSVRMKRHAFLHGSCVPAGAIVGGSVFDNQYRAAIDSYFRPNYVGFCNALKWPRWVDPAWRKNLTVAEAWLQDPKRNITLRAHNLLWQHCGTPQYMPDVVCDQLKALNRTQLGTSVLLHLQDEATYLNAAGYWDVDVANEVSQNHEVDDVLQGVDSLSSWVKWTKQHAPNVRTRLNEDRTCLATPATRPGYELDRMEFYDGLFSDLEQRFTPLDGFGCESHLDGSQIGGELPGMQAVLARLSRFQAHNLTVTVTEFDAKTKDLGLYRDFARDYLIAVFSHPVSEGFVSWGINDQTSWEHNAPWFFSNWTAKPAFYKYSELLFNAWWTNETAATSADGSASVPAYFGLHEVKVEDSNGIRSDPVSVWVGTGGAQVHIQV